MPQHTQLTLDFEHRPSLSGDDFFVAPCNREALGWVEKWPDWPVPAVIIHGPQGSGKTHLAQVFLGLYGGASITACKMALSEPDVLIDAHPALVLENADRFIVPELEAEVFHLYNLAKEYARPLLLTSRKPPSQWGIGLADLRSRLLASPAPKIGAPDDMLMSALVMKQFSDRQIRIDGDVLAYLLTRMERSFEGATRLVAAIDRHALQHRRRITVPLVREVIEGLEDDAGAHRVLGR
ncbi:HdaA/DnaA family protein [Varunaivibrio sulfuroxidans]|uniref:DnaA protein n=1 Tax=Varunaivibrio sulfuroxidans TaxID=1773489 RepID=A0A4R3J528_9PROT|nr:DnaA/Hda family protein [Varunaivibrio sulfuroxidans]TCS60372.1 DnaA protein [Varunaivibrio sulfuroxidans]WES30940.1 DnaA/Hda family protein [Varunaivibrio sulfuroxidans]